MLRKLLDSNNNSGWLVLGVGILMIGIFASFFTPVILTLFRFKNDTSIGYTPREQVFIVQFGAFLALTLGIYLIYKLKRISARILSGISGIILFIVFTIASYNLYIYVDEQYIEVGNGFSVKQYTWGEVKRAEYDKTSDNVASYTLTMEDDKKIEVVFGGLLHSGVQIHIRRSVEALGLKVIDIS